MAKKSKKERKQQGQFTPLDKHARKDGKLRPPLTQLEVKPVDWPRDLLPEHLWIAALFDAYPGPKAIKLYNEFLEAIDEISPPVEKFIALGFLTDFGQAAVLKRSEFISSYKDLILAAFHKPFGRLLAFYPSSPALWLVLQDELEREGALDPQVELQKLSNLVADLLPGKTLAVGHIRSIALNRLFKHSAATLNAGMVDCELLPKYADGCTEEEQYRVQKFALSTLNTHYMLTPEYEDKSWPRSFWQHNYDLVPCNPLLIGVKGVEANDENSILSAVRENGRRVANYLDKLERHVRIDLYDPTRDEILLGLLSRISRLFVHVTHDTGLWSIDSGGIFLRCLVETAITFCYLAQHGTAEDFDSFKKYGEGREKLLMLQFQDNYPGEKTRDGRSEQDLLEGIGGGFWPEFMDIELGWWTKKSSRELAIVAGLEKLYRLVYDPTSGDVHGTWSSLKSSNMALCAQPLHRYHWLPSLGDRPLLIKTVLDAQEIYMTAVDFGSKYLAYPLPDEQLTKVPDHQEAVESND